MTLLFTHCVIKDNTGGQWSGQSDIMQSISLLIRNLKERQVADWSTVCTFFSFHNLSAERTEQIKGPISKAQWHKLILWILARLRRQEECNQVYDPYHCWARSPQSQFSSKSNLSSVNNWTFKVWFVPIKWLELIIAIALWQICCISDDLWNSMMDLCDRINQGQKGFHFLD